MADALAAAAALRDAAGAVRSGGRAVQDGVRTPPGRVEAPDAAQHGAPLFRPIRVLVVDDLALLRQLLVRQLTRAGHRVVGEAATAAEAVVQARALRPDVVLLDVHLPDELGTVVAARLAAGVGPVPPPGVVFCTGDRAGALAAGVGDPHTGGGAWAVLEKPVRTTALDRAVREAARQRPPS